MSVGMGTTTLPLGIDLFTLPITEEELLLLLLLLLRVLLGVDFMVINVDPGGRPPAL